MEWLRTEFTSIFWKSDGIVLWIEKNCNFGQCQNIQGYLAEKYKNLTYFCSKIILKNSKII